MSIMWLKEFWTEKESLKNNNRDYNPIYSNACKIIFIVTHARLSAIPNNAINAQSLTPES